MNLMGGYPGMGYGASAPEDGDSILHQNEIKQLLMDPGSEIYHSGRDPIYETFRQHIRDREGFNNNVLHLKLNDKIRIWRTKRDIEADCRAALRKREDKVEEKQKLVDRYLFCGCLFKRPDSFAVRKERWLRGRSERISGKKQRE